MRKVKKYFDLNANISNLKYYIDLVNDKSVVHISFDNLGYGDITAIKFDACGYNSFDDVVFINGKEKFFLIIQDIVIHRNQNVTDLKVILPEASIKKIDLQECQICYADGSIVTYEGECIKEVELEEYDVSDYVEHEQLVALKNRFGDCYKYKAKVLDEGWICGCGRYNKVDMEVCSNCNAQKDLILKANEGTEIEQLIEECKAVELQKTELKKKKEEEKKQARIKQKIYIGIGIAVAILLAVLINLSGRSTFSSEEEMKRAVSGVYTYYDNYKPKYMLVIYDNTLEKYWLNLNDGMSLDIKKWSPRFGTFTTSTDKYVVLSDGNIKEIDGGKIYESDYSSSSSASNSSSYSYETAQTALKISDVQISRNSSSIVCTGRVTNNGEKKYEFIKVRGAFKDSSGAVIDTDWTYAVGSEGLLPGESATFKMFVDNDYSIDSCSVSLMD